MSVTVLHGDCLAILPTLEAGSIDACVSDPPYHLTSIVKRFGSPSAAEVKSNMHSPGGAPPYKRLTKGFMGKQWDGGDIAFRSETWAAVLRVLKPGAHLVAFGGTRTYHRLACAVEDAGFEIRDAIMWHYGSGFPKSHDVSKGIDRAAGAEREVVGENPTYREMQDVASAYNLSRNPSITAPATDAARQWQGWGTALKPATEIIVLARKPLIGTVAANVLQHGTGALNIDGCRVDSGESTVRPNNSQMFSKGGVRDDNGRPALNRAASGSDSGRWPANLIHDGSAEVLERFPESESTRATVTSKSGSVYGMGAGLPSHTGEYGFNDSGSAARFFYSPKADAADRLQSKHPTIKPVDLMAYLCRLITPPGGTVLDPFAGSGTTGMACLREGFNAVLIEREAEYVADINRRIQHVSGNDTPLFAEAGA